MCYSSTAITYVILLFVTNQLDYDTCFELEVVERSFENTKGAIRISTTAKRKSTKGQTTIYKTYT